MLATAQVRIPPTMMEPHPNVEKSLGASSQRICVARRAARPATIPRITKIRRRTQHGPQTANQRAVLNAYLRDGGINVQTRNATDPETRKKNMITAAIKRIMPLFFPSSRAGSIDRAGPERRNAREANRRNLRRPHLY